MGRYSEGSVDGKAMNEDVYPGTCKREEFLACSVELPDPTVAAAFGTGKPGLGILMGGGCGLRLEPLKSHIILVELGALSARSFKSRSPLEPD